MSNSTGNVELPLISGRTILRHFERDKIFEVEEFKRVKYRLTLRFPFIKREVRTCSKFTYSGFGCDTIFHTLYSMSELCEALDIDFRSKEEIRMNSTLKNGEESGNEG